MLDLNFVRENLTGARKPEFSGGRSGKIRRIGRGTTPRYQ
jgi:hypothetical protein